MSQRSARATTEHDSTRSPCPEQARPADTFEQVAPLLELSLNLAFSLCLPIPLPRPAVAAPAPAAPLRAGFVVHRLAGLRFRRSYPARRRPGMRTADGVAVRAPDHFVHRHRLGFA